MVLDDAEFSLDLLLARAFEMVKDRAQEKGLELVLDTDHLPNRLRGDPTRLSQALINLLTNAVKFTPAGGTVTVTARAAKRGEVHVSVRDTGIGIPAAKLESVFEPFVQVDAGHTRRREGTGLGLAISRDLARGMGGDLTAESTPGEGSTFTLTLPRGERRNHSAQH